MEILLSIVAVMTAINTILLVAIAGTVAKLIRYPDVEEEVPSQKNGQLLDLPKSVYRNEAGELLEVGPPTYDMAVLKGKAEPYSDGLERRLTPTRNWDGISQQ